MHRTVTVTVAAAALACSALPVTAQAVVGKPAAQIMKRLSGAGYTVRALQLLYNPNYIAHLDVRLPGGHKGNVEIYVYASAVGSTKAARTFENFPRKFANQIQVAKVGVDLYVGSVASPAVIPIVAFNKIVKVAEGHTAVSATPTLGGTPTP